MKNVNKKVNTNIEEEVLIDIKLHEHHDTKSVGIEIPGDIVYRLAFSTNADSCQKILKNIFDQGFPGFSEKLAKIK